MNAEAPAIALDPQILSGKPVIAGTRLSVEFVIGLLAEGWSEAEISPIILADARSYLGLSRLCARRLEFGESVPERGLTCAFSATRTFPARASPR